FDFLGQIHVWTDEHRHTTRESFHHTEPKVFMIRRQGQQRTVTQNCVLLLAFEPAGKENRANGALILNLLLESRDVIFRSLSSEDQIPAGESLLLDKRQKCVKQNIKALGW